jgi:hypothetical protein
MTIHPRRVQTVKSEPAGNFILGEEQMPQKTRKKTAAPASTLGPSAGHGIQTQAAPAVGGCLLSGQQQTVREDCRDHWGGSGIGRAVAIALAREGADVAVIYLNEHEDAQQTRSQVEEEGRTCQLVPGDIREGQFCRNAIELTVGTFNQLDILVNNTEVHYPQKSITDITAEQLQKTFQTNIFSMFYWAAPGSRRR